MDNSMNGFSHLRPFRGDEGEFYREIMTRLERQASDGGFKDEFVRLINYLHTGGRKYIYGFQWLGRPVIQSPSDLMVIQEIVYATKPDVIIETGVARGGSLIFYASICRVLGRGRVVGIDLDIRPHNREAIESHALADLVELLDGDCLGAETLSRVRSNVAGKTVMVVLDSNHTDEHVFAELQAYAPFVTPGSYLVVCDTTIDYMTPAAIGDRPWGAGNSPLSAVRRFLESNPDFEIDPYPAVKSFATMNWDGFLRRKSPATGSATAGADSAGASSGS